MGSLALAVWGLVALAMPSQPAGAADLGDLHTPTGSVPESAPATPAPGSTSSRFVAARYTPAILRLSVTSPEQARGTSYLDLTFIPPDGELVGRRLEIGTDLLAGTLRRLYAQLSRQDPLDLENPQAPARLLHQWLLAPLAEDLRRSGVTTLLIAADPGLQAIPFAALHDGSSFFGERYAISLTPSLALIPLDVPGPRADKRQLAAGASRFDGLAPLPLVPQELQRVERGSTALFLDGNFTPEVLLQTAADTEVDRVHVATHAEFLPGGPAKARLYTGTGPIGLAKFAELRERRRGAPLDLFSLSACRTALGDNDSELGFAGLALQAGARSAIGTLWYVDDVATSAFFVQFYRFLDQGMPKAEALQATRVAMATGTLRLQGDRVLGPDGATLLDDLTPAQQRRIDGGMAHPYFWSGISLLGTPW